MTELASYTFGGSKIRSTAFVALAFIENASLIEAGYSYLGQNRITYLDSSRWGTLLKECAVYMTELGLPLFDTTDASIAIL